MTSLVIQKSQLDQLAKDLATIAKQFAEADDFSSALADAVGNDALGGRVEQFSRSWNDRRKNMTEQVTALQAQVEAISDALTQVDVELAKALTDAATASNAPSNAPQSSAQGRGKPTAN